MWYPKDYTLDRLVHEYLVGNEVVLIDGDIVAYRFACLNEDSIDWGNGASTLTDIDRAVNESAGFINHIKKMCGADAVLVCFTGSTNFRKREFPDYKSNRKAEDKPKLLDDVKEAIAKEWRSIKREDLEADDLMGILATHPMLRSTTMIATIDKDLDQIEGWHYNWNHNKTYEVLQKEGANYFWKQVLMGDTTDGYKGCNLIGAKKAEALLEGCHADDVCFPIVYSAYINAQQNADLKEQELTYKHDLAYLISQARCAKMLQADDYDWVKDKPIMWQPPMPEMRRSDAYIPPLDEEGDDDDDS